MITLITNDKKTMSDNGYLDEEETKGVQHCHLDR